MIAYWLLIGLPTLLSFLAIPAGKPRRALLWLVALVYQVFVGLRYQVGADRVAYGYMHQYIAAVPLSQALAFTEPGYAALNWGVARLGGNMDWVNFAVSLVFVSGLVRLASLLPNPWIALVSVTPYLVIAIGMSAVRQSAAIGLVFHLMASWRQGPSRKLLLSGIAASFHYSAVMAFIFVQQSIWLRSWVRGLLLALAAAAIFPVLNSSDAYAKYYATYLEGNLLSPGAFMHVLLNAIPGILYLLLRKRWHARFGKNDLLPMLSVLSIASIFGVSVSSTGIDRLALYLSPIQMMVYGSLPVLFGRQYQILWCALIAGYNLVVMYWWLNYANTAKGFLPYDNWLAHWFAD